MFVTQRNNNLFDCGADCYYIKPMQYEWDNRKNAANKIKHGMEFREAEGFHWNNALETIDDREDYGEERRIALGLICGRVHVLIFTRRADNIRLISLRKANKRELEIYEQSK